MRQINTILSPIFFYSVKVLEVFKQGSEWRCLKFFKTINRYTKSSVMKSIKEGLKAPIRRAQRAPLGFLDIGWKMHSALRLHLIKAEHCFISNHKKRYKTSQEKTMKNFKKGKKIHHVKKGKIFFKRTLQKSYKNIKRKSSRKSHVNWEKCPMQWDMSKNDKCQSWDMSKMTHVNLGKCQKMTCVTWRPLQNLMSHIMK